MLQLYKDFSFTLENKKMEFIFNVFHLWNQFEY